MYFEHVKSLGFDDRPDYDYLKRLFRELFFRKGFTYDSIFDWDVVSQNQAAAANTSAVVAATSGAEAAANNDAIGGPALPPINSFDHQGEPLLRSSILNQQSSELIGSRPLDNSTSVLADKSGMSVYK